MRLVGLARKFFTRLASSVWFASGLTCVDSPGLSTKLSLPSCGFSAGHDGDLASEVVLRLRGRAVLHVQPHIDVLDQLDLELGQIGDHRGARRVLELIEVADAVAVSIGERRRGRERPGYFTP